jgi:isocitrate dehydrogenase
MELVLKSWMLHARSCWCRGRFTPSEAAVIQKGQIIQFMQRALDLNIDVIKNENLYHLEGVAAFSLGQGQ